MPEQSVAEAVDTLLSLAFANPDGVAEAMSRAIDMMEARESLIALIEASEARAEKAEAFALKHGAYRLKGQPGNLRLECQGCGKVDQEPHKPGCYVAEIEARRGS